MKKFLSIFVSLLFYSFSFAQFAIWSNGEIIFQVEKDKVDSIVFGQSTADKPEESFLYDNVYLYGNCTDPINNREDGRFRLIYIGKSSDISDRVTDEHEHFHDWVRWAYDNVCELRFSVVKLPPGGDLNSCEEAIIYKFQPPINNRCKATFDHEDIQITFILLLII